MPSLSALFTWDTDPGLLRYGEHDPWLVLLSVLVAVFASAMGLHAAAQAGRVAHRPLQNLMLLAGCVSLGCGVWAMHFIGMLAFRLCTAVHYDIGLTLLSVVPSMGASWVALRLLSRTQVSWRELLTSGTLVGAGIGTMHYTGMAAMRMSALLRYDPFGFALSIVVAVGLAVLALWLRFGMATLARRATGAMQASLSGIVMGLAIAGMHYTGMAAARFIGHADATAGQQPTDSVPLALGITLVTVIASVMVAAASGLVRYRQLVQELQAKAAQLNAVSDTSIDGIVVFNERGTVLAFNAGAERIFMRAGTDTLGHSVTELMVEPFRGQAQANFPAFAARMRYGMESNAFAPRPDGSLLPIRLVVGQASLPGHTLYIAFVTDISERVQMEQAMRHSEQQFRSLIGNIPGVSYRCELAPGWPMVFVSEAVEQVTGYPPEGFVGAPPAMRFIDMVPEDEAQQIKEMLRESVADNRPHVMEFQLRHRDGSQRWVWGSGRAVADETGQPRWLDGVLIDITGRHQMEDDLREAKLRAEDAAAARTAFLANMSHEIRTPMNAIIGFTEVVLEAGLPEESRKHLQTVRSSARALLVLLNDILDTSKLERGAVELEHIHFTLPDVVHQLTEELALQARRKGLDLSWHIDPEVGAHFTGDPHRLRQVLLNLLGNAIKFTDHGRVSLHIGREGHEPGAHLHFAVTDTGIGIPADRLERIFEPFTQSDASMSRRFGGTGLGTTISRQLVELMHGRIWVESTEGQGSTFHVSLPMAPGEAPELPTGPTASALKLPPLRILVADDVPENVALLHVMLGRHGHLVDTAANGREAVARHAQGHYDVILMDVQMPELDGLSACGLIRAHEQATGLPRTPVIALTASVFQEDRHAAFDAGMDGFATKPVDLPALEAEIARVTGLGEAGAPGLGDTGPAAPAQGGHADALIDRHGGLQRWGDPAAWAHALQQFAHHQAGLAAGTDSPDLADQATLQALAHRLRGAAANLGLPALARQAQALEDAARQPGATPLALQPSWQALVTTLNDTLAEVHTLARATPATQEANTRPTTPADLPALQTMLDQLASAFPRGDPLDKVLKRFTAQARTLLPDHDIDRLLQAVDGFDFDTALVCLDPLRAALGERAATLSTTQAQPEEARHATP